MFTEHRCVAMEFDRYGTQLLATLRARDRMAFPIQPLQVRLAVFFVIAAYIVTPAITSLHRV